MIRRRLWISLVGIVTVTIALLAVNLIAGNEPVLGLDLQGGISVVLSAEEGATAEDLDGIRDLIRDELEGRGIAEPDVRVEGENVIVDLPGVRDQREALDAVDVAGIVQLRPLMQQCTPPVEDVATSEPTVTDSSIRIPAAGADRPDAVDRTGRDRARRRPSPSGFRAATPATRRCRQRPSRRTRRRLTRPRRTRQSPPNPPSPARRRRRSRRSARSGTNPVTTYPPTPYGPPPPPTDETVTELPTADGLTCVVGPVELGPIGRIRWAAVRPWFGERGARPGAGLDRHCRPDSEGAGTFNQLASACFTQQQNCPVGALAIVLDGVVQSAPAVTEASYPETISISGQGPGRSPSPKRDRSLASSIAAPSRCRCARSRCRPCPRRSERTRCERRSSPGSSASSSSWSG